MKQKIKIFILAILLLTCAFSLYAREIEITVLDYDLSLPLEGAVIRSWDQREYTSNKDGIVHLQVPDNRQVIVHVMYPGYENYRILIPVTQNSFTASLRLSGIILGRELVVEAARPGTSETQTGRSIALTGREITQTAEIGVIEDVMSSVKLLPGVGYSGLFNAQPSIRGGDPQDIRASLDGFYIFHPYHWGGGFSIFSPRMVESAQLSHGIFSSRYGNTISGLLEVRPKKPSSEETEFEYGISTSAASFNVSLPFTGRGGVLLMGNVTYYEPFIWLAKQVSNNIDNEDLDSINGIRVPPYIRSSTVTGNYRFTERLELSFTGFLGMDGIGVSFESSNRTSELESDSDMDFDWITYQTFLTTSLAWNPRNEMLIKFAIGAGFQDAIFDIRMTDRITEKSFHKTPANDWYYDDLRDGISSFNEIYSLDTYLYGYENAKLTNIQGRIDFDYELGKGFLFAAGIQELYLSGIYKMYQAFSSQDVLLDKFDINTQESILQSLGVYDNNPALKDLLINNMRISFPVSLPGNMENHIFNTSAYSLVEYASLNNRFNAELGLRFDHFYLTGMDGLSLSAKPALNPRLNLDFNIFKNRRIIQSFNITGGTGLFSSMNDMIVIADKMFNLEEIKPNRSWTSVLGAKFEFYDGFLFNIEGYYKYIFDRTYIPVNYGLESMEILPQFNGEGRTYGIDIMLQKKQSRFWDGWLSYSFNWTKLRDPNSGMDDFGYAGEFIGDSWYFPTYHRFHNLNLVLNYKPRQNMNLYVRLGMASGILLEKLTGEAPLSYPVYVYDRENPENNKVIEKFYWPSERDESNRTTPSFPMDIKFSIFNGSQNGKTRYEIYVAIENVLALLYTSQGNRIFNPYTGQVESGSNSASYDMPVPMPSFGVKFSF
ncbi:MAG: TonB-dependent receptor plug domain-containing protein [Treponema sp.]|nr:TonB-dependent receptor plug domain-containing protein [Treponema sp.]